MTIDSVNTVMSLQSQQLQTKTVESAQKSAEYSTQQTAAQGAVQDLSTTEVVANTSASAEAGNEQQSSGKDNQAQIQETIQENATATNERLKEAVARFNKSSGANSEAVFGIHEGTNRVTIKIVDKTTKDVIKELPPEKTLDMIAKVWEMAGIMVDEKR